jgi:2-polyprenyl-6-hydroxyphenyl methylase / 3-demethylubiquinone-9 3-methyltransferase
MFITPDELKASLARHGLQNKDLVGTKMNGNPIKMILALMRYKAGKVSGAELGKNIGLKEGTNISSSYMGYAMKL